ncbi:MAG: ROK family protein [Puia sp.]|nr:ROK family protein [Puia sp.]
MAVLGIDLGGTKAAFFIFSAEGVVLHRDRILLRGAKSNAVAELIVRQISASLGTAERIGQPVEAIGISVPGIVYHDTGAVWAPNIPGWDNYPLLQEIKTKFPHIPATIDNDRACYILGECWQGNTRGCRNAIYLSVGTGIGAGILAEGNILRGAGDVAGAIGWMALASPYREAYAACGFFEHYASGDGIARLAAHLLKKTPGYYGELSADPSSINSYTVFAAFENKDLLALEVMDRCLEYWGMAVANLVSLFNPEKIILGGGIFGPAVSLIPDIKKEAAKWAQPIAAGQYVLEGSALDRDAGVYGAACLALRAVREADDR